MSFNNELHELDELDAAHAPLAYTRLCSWGYLSVTEQARDECGLVPVQAHDIMSPTYPTFRQTARNDSAPSLRVPVSVLLCGPGEWVDDTTKVEAGSYSGKIVLGPSAAYVLVSSGATALGTEMEVELALAASRKKDLESLDPHEQILFDGQRIEFWRACQQHAARLIVQGYAGVVGQYTQAGALEWLRNADNQTLWNTARGRAGRAGAFLLASIGGMLFMDGQTLTQPGMLKAIPFGLALGSLREGLDVARTVHDHLATSNEQEHDRAVYTSQLGERVSNEITRLFMAQPAPPQ